MRLFFRPRAKKIAQRGRAKAQLGKGNFGARWRLENVVFIDPDRLLHGNRLRTNIAESNRKSASMELVQSSEKEPRTLRLNPQDNVATAVDAVDAGKTSSGIKAGQRIPKGHKMALQKIAKGEPVRKFGQVIGFAKSDIAPGEWVHEHNVGDGRIRARLRICTGLQA